MTQAYVLLKQVLNQAVADRLIPRNPAEAVRPPRATKKDIRPLTSSEVCRMLTTAHGDRWEALYVVAATTGLRQGWLLGLSWDDIDLDRGVLRVRRTLGTPARRYSCRRASTLRSSRMS